MEAVDLGFALAAGLRLAERLTLVQFVVEPEFLLSPTQFRLEIRRIVGEFVDKGPIVLGMAFFDKGRCLPHAMQIPCVVCEEVCPVSPKAIQTVDEEVKTVFGEMVVLNKPFIVPALCIGCGICQAECPVLDQRAVYVTAVGESRSTERSLLLKSRPKTG